MSGSKDSVEERKETKKLKKGKEYDRSGAEKTWHELRGSLVPLKRLVLTTCMHQVSATPM